MPGDPGPVSRRPRVRGGRKHQRRKAAQELYRAGAQYPEYPAVQRLPPRSTGPPRSDPWTPSRGSVPARPAPPARQPARRLPQPFPVDPGTPVAATAAPPCTSPASPLRPNPSRRCLFGEVERPVWRLLPVSVPSLEYRALPRDDPRSRPSRPPREWADPEGHCSLHREPPPTRTAPLPIPLSPAPSPKAAEDNADDGKTPEAILELSWTEELLEQEWFALCADALAGDRDLPLPLLPVRPWRIGHH